MLIGSAPAPSEALAAANTRTDGLSPRGLAALTAVVWGLFCLVSIAYAWEPISARLDMIWRPIAADAAGAALSVGCAMILHRTRNRAVALRLGLAAALSLGAVFLYVVATLILIAPLDPTPMTVDTVGVRILRMMALHYWVFIAFMGLFLLLDQPQGSVARPDDPEEIRYARLKERLSGRVEVYEGLNARWFWTFQAVFWTLMAVFSTANFVAGGDNFSDAWRIMLAELAGLGVSAAAHYGLLRPTRMWPLYRRAALAIAIAVGMCSIYVTAIWLAMFQIFPLTIEIGDGETLDTGLGFFISLFPRWMFLNFPVFVGWAGFYLALDSARRMRHQERQLYNSMLLAQEAQLKMLRFQLNPHFLFNTLNAISTLVLDRRGADAEAMLSRLSRFLRFTLDAAPDDQTTLEREVAAQRLYLEIEKARFAERLEVEIQLEPGVAGALVPTLILQPLTENAVKYAVARSKTPVRLTITGRRDPRSGALILEVADDGPGVAADTRHAGAGVGLANIKARLAVLYGDAALMQAGPRPEGGFSVRLILPFELASDAMRTGELS